MRDQTQIIAFEDLKPTAQVVEIFYQRALELVKVAYQAINRAYPLADRKESPKLEGRHAEALRQAKQHLNFHKKVVAEFIPALCQVKRHASRYDYSQDLPTKQLRGFLEVQLTLLHDKLRDYADVLLPEADDIESFLRSLDKVFETESQTLLEQPAPLGIINYEISPVLKAADFQEKFGPQFTVHPRTKQRRDLSERAAQ